jgi:hypothetical protein
MFLAVVAAALVAVRRNWAYALTACMVAYAAVSSLLVFPYYMAYSNEAFGGAPKTYTRLHDSNVDWGQDLGRLAHRLHDRYPGQQVWLVYKGAGVPSWYGIQSSDPLAVPPSSVHGLLVVSDDWIDKAGPQLNALLAGATPIDEVGYSITIFRR